MQISDNFNADSSADWNAQGSAFYDRDAVNGELIQDWSDYGALIHDNNTGSIECEAQLTGRLPSVTLNHWAGPGVRLTAGNGYGIVFAADYDGGGPPGSGGLTLIRYNAETLTALMYFSLAPGIPTTLDWLTIRMAVEGVVNANAAIKIWVQEHGSSKPSDPGWIGDDNDPDFTFTDTDANRLDASGDIGVGICGLQNVGNTTRGDYWRARAISDRASRRWFLGAR